MRSFYRNCLIYNDNMTYRTCRARCPHVEPLRSMRSLVNSSLNYTDCRGRRGRSGSGSLPEGAGAGDW